MFCNRFDQDSDLDSKNNLPKSWVWTMLGEIATVASGGTPSTKVKNYLNGNIPWITPADLSNYDNKYIASGARFISKEGLQNSSAVLLPAGTVLFSSRAPIGYVAIAANNICTNQGFKNFIPSESVFNEYLFYYLKGNKHLAETFASGTTFLELSASNAAKLPFPLPPLPEQRRIVAKIEELFTRLDAGVEALRKVKAEIKRYRQAVLKHAFEGRLSEEWREIHENELEPASMLLNRILEERRFKFEKEQPKKRYKEPSSPENYELPEIPGGWIWTNFEQLAEAIPNAIKAGPFGSALKKEFYVPRGYKIYGQEQVIKGDPFFGNYYIDKDRYAILKSCKVKTGDLLISLVGTIGKVLILPEGIEEGIINPRLVKISLDKKMVNVRFIKAYLESNNIKYYFSLKSHGGTMDILNLALLKELPIPLPSLKEQEIIINGIELCFSIADEVEAAVDQSLKQAERLRQSILKRAFEGRLVPQDPTDEPAEKLIERIKLEKTKQSNEGKIKQAKRKMRKITY